MRIIVWYRRSVYLRFWDGFVLMWGVFIECLNIVFLVFVGSMNIFVSVSKFVRI